LFPFNNNYIKKLLLNNKTMPCGRIHKIRKFNEESKYYILLENFNDLQEDYMILKKERDIFKRKLDEALHNYMADIAIPRATWTK
jgi:hypothetical protein